MKKIFLLLYVFLMPSSLFAENTNPNSLDVGGEISHIIYKEPGVMKESGLMYGINGAFTHHKKYMLKAEARAIFGQVDYKNSGTINNIDDFIIELRGLAGYDFMPDQQTRLTPYIGLATRYLNDAVGGKVTSTGALGYDRESTYLYSPFGIEIMRELRNTWSVGAALEYDLFWRGWQKSHLSDVSLGYNDLENTQKNGYGLRASVKCQKELGSIDLVIEPFIRYWNIKQSDTASITFTGVIMGYGYEPKNNSTEYGLKIGMKF